MFNILKIFKKNEPDEFKDEKFKENQFPTN